MTAATPLEDIRQDHLVSGIRTWVAMETPPHDKPRLVEFAEAAVHEARSLGLDAAIIPSGPEALPLVRIAATGRTQEKPVLVLGHFDTVHPVGTLDRNRLRFEGERMFGPGTYDMKAGAYLALRALAALHRERAPERTIELLLVPDEETGSTNSRDRIEASARNAAVALLGEPARVGGHCVTGRKGVGFINIKARGQPSHAGLDHEKGRSALRELAHQVLALESMTDYDEGITFNVGRIVGGSNRNVVPESASLEAEFRVVSREQAEYVLRAVRALTPKIDGVELEVDAFLNRPPYERTPETVAVFERARRIAARTGFDLGEVPLTGGGSDGNFTSALGVPTLDGLGADGDGAHTLNEFILTSTLTQRLAFWHGMLADLAWTDG